MCAPRGNLDAGRVCGHLCPVDKPRVTGISWHSSSLCRQRNQTAQISGEQVSKRRKRVRKHTTHLRRASRHACPYGALTGAQLFHLHNADQCRPSGKICTLVCRSRLACVCTPKCLHARLRTHMYPSTHANSLGVGIGTHTGQNQ